MIEDKYMVTIGDAFSIVAILAGLALTAWGFMIACALLFPARVEVARNAISLGYKKCLGWGVLSLLIAVFGVIVFNIPNPGFKLLGFMIFAGYLGCVAIGMSGISKLASERFRVLAGSETSLFAAYSKSAAYIVIASLLPVLGWFLFAPALILAAGGAGLMAIRRNVSAVNEAI
jgi:hypothetical protein